MKPAPWLTATVLGVLCATERDATQQRLDGRESNTVQPRKSAVRSHGPAWPITASVSAAPQTAQVSGIVPET